MPLKHHGPVAVLVAALTLSHPRLRAAADPLDVARDYLNTPDFNGSPHGGPSLDFDFPIDLSEHAQNYRDAVVATCSTATTWSTTSCSATGSTRNRGTSRPTTTAR